MHASRSKGAMEPYDYDGNAKVDSVTRMIASLSRLSETRNKHVIYGPSSHHYATHQP